MLETVGLFLWCKVVTFESKFICKAIPCNSELNVNKDIR